MNGGEIQQYVSEVRDKKIRKGLEENYNCWELIELSSSINSIVLVFTVSLH